ncbi:MAG: CRISPR-associated endonuclease Cas3'', partial [Planctomycetota bacterium]
MVDSDFSRLLAKSCPNSEHPPDWALLSGHLTHVDQAASAVLAATGDRQLEALGLQPGHWHDRLTRVVRLAALVHDLGKANDHFQGMVRWLRSGSQGLRHEWVTYLILQEADLQQWLRIALTDIADWAIVLWSVTGHHPAHNRPSPPREIPSGTGNGQMRVLMGHPDFGRCLDHIAEAFDLTAPPLFRDVMLPLIRTSRDSALARITRASRESLKTWRGFNDEERRFVAACKACLVAVDVAGSALPKARGGSDDLGRWVSKSLDNLPASEHLASLVKERLDGKPVRPFQRDVAEAAGRVVLVRAGCGTGKTLAAYLRAAKRWPDHRLYFCYPTTGTATEGFRGYLFDPVAGTSKHHARLFHSRAAIDLEMIVGVRPDEDTTEEQLRLESLSAWSTPIVCCTVDTVLGLTQNHRRGLYAWPALAQSAFVFDEIHAYDHRLFGGLLRFIEAMRGSPILLITAGLPTSYLGVLNESLARIGESLEEINGPVDQETLPRYYALEGQDPF